MIFMLFFNRVLDREVAQPLEVKEGANRNILRYLELGLSFSTVWT